MANTRFQSKRTTVSGRVPNTTISTNSQYIAMGEFALNMTDKILYTSDGASPIYVGANQVNMNVTNSLNIGANLIINTTALSVSSGLVTFPTQPNGTSNTTGATTAFVSNAVTYQAPYPNTVPRNIVSKAQTEIISLLDFGADPTGLTYSDNALNAAIYAAGATVNLTFNGPPGPSSNVVIAGNNFTGTTVTFVASGATGSQVNIGANASLSANALYTFLNTNVLADPNVNAYYWSVNNNIISGSLKPSSNQFSCGITYSSTSNTFSYRVYPTIKVPSGTYIFANSILFDLGNILGGGLRFEGDGAGVTNFISYVTSGYAFRLGTDLLAYYGYISFANNPANNATIALGGTTLTFTTNTSLTGTGTNYILLGSTLTSTLQNATTYLNSSSDTNITKCYYSYWGGVLGVNTKNRGNFNNSFTLAASTTPNAYATLSAGTLSQGTPYNGLGGGASNVYSHLRGIGFSSNYPGTTLQLGRRDLIDYVNGLDLDVVVSNSNQMAGNQWINFSNVPANNATITIGSTTTTLTTNNALIGTGNYALINTTSTSATLTNLVNFLNSSTDSNISQAQYTTPTDFSQPTIGIYWNVFSPLNVTVSSSPASYGTVGTLQALAGVEYNGIITSTVCAYTSLMYYGHAWRIRGAAMTKFTGSAGGADIGVYLTTNNINPVFGNIFDKLDLEVNWRDIVIDNQYVSRNKFTGGQLDWSTLGGACAIDASAGYGNIIECGALGQIYGGCFDFGNNIGISTLSEPTLGGVGSGTSTSTGVITYSSLPANNDTITLGSSTVTFTTNTSLVGTGNYVLISPTTTGVSGSGTPLTISSYTGNILSTSNTYLASVGNAITGTNIPAGTVITKVIYNTSLILSQTPTGAVSTINYYTNPLPQTALFNTITNLINFLTSSADPNISQCYYSRHGGRTNAAIKIAYKTTTSYAGNMFALAASTGGTVISNPSVASGATSLFGAGYNVSYNNYVYKSLGLSANNGVLNLTTIGNTSGISFTSINATSTSSLSIAMANNGVASITNYTNNLPLYISTLGTGSINFNSGLNGGTTVAYFNTSGLFPGTNNALFIGTTTSVWNTAYITNINANVVTSNTSYTTNIYANVISSNSTITGNTTYNYLTVGSSGINANVNLSLGANATITQNSTTSANFTMTSNSMSSILNQSTSGSLSLTNYATNGPFILSTTGASSTQDFYVNGVLINYISSTGVYPGVNNILNLGTAGATWLNIYGTNIYANTLTTNTATVGSLSSASAGLTSYSSGSYGVFAQSVNYIGMYAVSGASYGIYGQSNTATGLVVVSNTGTGATFQSNTGSTIASFSNATFTALTVNSTAMFSNTSAIINGLTTANGISIKAGTTTLAPLTFASGTNLTTQTTGSVEFDGSAFYGTPSSTSGRGAIPTEQWILQNAAYTLTSQTAAQKLFNTSTNGAITLPVGTYMFECMFSLSALSASSGTFGFALGGTAVNTQSWTALANKPASLSTPTNDYNTYNTAASVALTSVNTNTVGNAWIRGIIRVTTSGTIIPQVSLGVAAAGVVGMNSYFKVTPVGSSTVTNVGIWS